LWELRKRREALAAELEELAKALARLRGATPRKAARPTRARKEASGRPRRKRGGKSLREAIAEVLASSSKGMRSGEIVQALQAGGYRFTGKNPQNMVSATLAGCKEFRRVRRGIYVLQKPKAEETKEKAQD